MAENSFAVEAHGLSKIFDDAVVAVAGIELLVRSGTITALLGGNGAGKSTTLAMLLGLVTPSTGSIRILGYDLRRERAAITPLINFSSPYVDLPNRLTVRQNLVVYGHLYGVPDLKRRIEDLTEQLQIGSFIDRRHGSLSAGQRTRSSLAKSLLNFPRLLLLDEPTASLDPDTADWVRELLMDYQKRTGATIFLASHNMLEVERMADEAIIMKNGTIANRGSPKELLTAYGRETLEEVFLDIARNRSNDHG